jgi:hypothetical protein
MRAEHAPLGGCCYSPESRLAVYGVGISSSRLPLNGVNFWDQAVSGGIMASNRQLEPLPWIST